MGEEGELELPAILSCQRQVEFLPAELSVCAEPRQEDPPCPPQVSTSQLATGCKHLLPACTELRKHLAEGATLVSTAEAGEGAGERAGARLKALSAICHSLFAKPGHTWESGNLQAQRVKDTVDEFVDEATTPS